MTIQNISVSNFMLFSELNTSFSPNINIISGENSSGKTALLKLLYAGTKSLDKLYSGIDEPTKKLMESVLAQKLQGVFRPNKNAIGRLVTRKQGRSKCDVSICFDDASTLSFGFSSAAEKNLELASWNISISPAAVYIPPKEIISATENFTSLYDDYHIAFEEVYYDLARLLDRPLKKGTKAASQQLVLEKLSALVNGSVTQKDRNFFLKVKDAGEFEMGLVSEGYRKLSTLMYLISNGSLNENSILFWDEPETNMNPRMIQPLAEAVMELSRMGVQVFITTHDYFVQQAFNLAAVYPDKENAPDIRFYSLYKTEEGIALETASVLGDLQHNAVMEEFDELYDREQRLIYDND